MGLLGIVAIAPACAVVSASTYITNYPSSDTALNDIAAASLKVGCTNENTTLAGGPAIRVTCKGGTATFFREKGTVRVNMGDKIIAECGDTPRPGCDDFVNQIEETAQGKSSGAGPASASATAPAASTAAPATSSAAPAASSAAPATSASGSSAAPAAAAPPAPTGP
jgi:hypothetical protein